MNKKSKKYLWYLGALIALIYLLCQQTCSRNSGTGRPDTAPPARETSGTTPGTEKTESPEPEKSKTPETPRAQNNTAAIAEQESTQDSTPAASPFLPVQPLSPLPLSCSNSRTGYGENFNFQLIPPADTLLHPARKRLKIWKISLPNISLSNIKLPSFTPPKRMDRGIVNYLFVPKGSWTGGLDVSYSSTLNTDYEFLLLKDWEGEAHTYKVSAFGGYFFKNNTAAGARFTYQRTYATIDNLSLELDEDLSFSIQDLYYIQQTYRGTAFVRTYVGLGENRRFGLFNESSISLGGGKGKLITGKGEELKGTYQTTKELQIGISPGLTTFITNNVAIEASVGVLGFKYKSVSQTTNQVHRGTRRTSGLNFKIDLFSINLGIAAYL